MKKRHLLYLLLLLIPIHAKAASMSVSCDKTSVNPKDTVNCSINVFDSEVSGGKGSVTVTNGTVTNITQDNCGFGETSESEFTCVDISRANSMTIVTYTIEVGNEGTTTFAVSDAEVVGTNFDSFSVDVPSVDISVNTYLVTLNNQGATTSGSTSVTTYYGGTIPKINVPTRLYTITYNYNGSGDANTTVGANYTFGGYYTGTNGTGTKYINADGTGAKTYDFNENKTFYAKWSGGSVTLPSPSRTGYTLEGWYDAATNGTKIGNSNATYNPTANKTLYAHWNANKYTITLNNKGATSAGTTAIYEKYDTGFYTDSNLTKQMTTSANGISVPVRKYDITLNNGGQTSTLTSTYTFNGYYTSVDASSSPIITSNGKLASGISSTKYSANATLYASWSPESVTLPTLSKEDYVFKGWYSAQTNGVKVGDGGSIYVPTENKTLYAIFKEILKSDNYEVKNKTVYAKPLASDYLQSELGSKIETANTVEVYNNKNVKISSSDPVGTGYRVKTSNVYYDVVVLGDVTGDGHIVLGDVAAIYNHYRGNKLLTGLYLEAAMLTGKNTVTIGDVAKIYNFYRGNATL